ncbi:MFS family permease [Leifsonia soli]|uniref:MFS family permease n=1 Tax=Leifsonia soli TaxID=582665 RepID=A0A852T338_9MICO|nr:MFS family permease [Leifsonia soli]
MTRRGPESVQDGALILGFVALGAVGAVIPASIPAVAERTGLAPEELLPSVSLLFLGLFAGVLVTAVPRRGRARTLLAVGSALQVAGLALVACATSAPLFFLAATVTGLGFGLVEASATALSRARSSEGTPVRLTVLNGASAVAAAGAPLLIAFVPAAALWAPVAALALVPAAGAVLAAVAGATWPGAEGSAPPPRVQRGAGRRLWPVGAALFLFVGAETVLAGWSSTLSQSLFGLAGTTAAVGTTAFWTLMAVGRFACAAVVARGVPARVYLPVAVGAAAVVAVLSAIVGQGVGAALLIGAVVLLVAPGYALLLGSALAATTRERADRTASILVAVGSAGGSAVSFAVAVTVGSAPAGVLLVIAGLLAGCALLSLAPLRSSRATRSPSPARPTAGSTARDS